jgi:hypothetical protein
MTTTTRPKKKKLLSPEERKACILLSKQEGLIAQRAHALLAIDTGKTQALAAETTGLTIGQVRYLLSTFRKKRLSLFPVPATDLPKEPEANNTNLDHEIDPITASSEEVSPKKEKPKKKKKRKKGKKKDKDKDKDKKEKKIMKEKTKDKKKKGNKKKKKKKK